MHRLKLRRPSPAFVLAAIALFVSLGGTGYAASRLTDGTGSAHAARRAAKPLTTSQVGKLIAAYIRKHRSSLRGATGATGATGASGPAGAAGGQGPAGPGAQRIVASNISGGGAQPLATVGPWALTLACSTSGPNASIVIRGPGTLTETTHIGVANGAAGQTFVGNGSTSSGFTSAVNSGGQIVLDGFLKNGETIYELHLQTTATNGGLFEACDVVGDAIPVS